MTRILVLGGGRQGRVMASELAEDYDVIIADARPLDLPIATRRLDLADPAALRAALEACDVALGALPARLGFAAAQAAAEVGRPLVDIAFYEEDPRLVDAAARATKVPILPDCGLAPGISNLIVGRALAAHPDIQRLEVLVGGVSADPSRPFGYVITWSPEDLLAEYTRPARIRRGGETVSLPALSELEAIEVPGLPPLEAFLSDGLRTLLDLPGPREMVEKTLRWPGHAAAVAPLIAEGRLVETLSRDCAEGEDLVVLLLRFDDRELRLIARPNDGLSAMARTTALTGASFARLIAEGRCPATGLCPPERIGADPDATRFLLDRLEGHGIAFEELPRDWLGL